MSTQMKYEEWANGFEYGPVRLIRNHCNESGWVVLQIETKKRNIQVHITRTGSVRLFDHATGKEYKVKL